MNTSDQPVSPESSLPANDMFDSVSPILKPLYAAKGWIMLLGILNIIVGAIQCLSCIGIIIGWLPIWLGILFVKASKSLDTAYSLRDPQSAKSALDNIATTFKIYGVLLIISLALFVLYIIGVILFLLIRAAQD